MTSPIMRSAVATRKPSTNNISALESGIGTKEAELDGLREALSFVKRTTRYAKEDVMQGPKKFNNPIPQILQNTAKVLGGMLANTGLEKYPEAQKLEDALSDFVCSLNEYDPIDDGSQFGSLPIQCAGSDEAEWRRALELIARAPDSATLPIG